MSTSQFAAFRDRFHVHVKIESITARPDADTEASGTDLKWLRSARHYVATLTVDGQEFPFATCYSQGNAHPRKPTGDQILCSLAQDCRGADASFEEWASEIGWDSDSRRAERIYEAIQRTRRGLLRLLGREGYAALLAIDEEA